jgi:putative membrane protein
VSDPLPDDAATPEDDEFRRLSPLTPIARSAIFLAAAAYTGGRQVIEEREFTGAAIAAAAVLVAGAVFGFASWYRTKFRITATELRIDTGVFNRRSRRVRLDRILEIGVNQPFVARLLGLAELKIETATTEAEVSLSYLPLGEAHEVRHVLLEQRDTARAREAGEEGAGGFAGGVSPPSAEPVPLVRVPLSWQVKGLLASGETVGLLLLGIAIGGVPRGRTLPRRLRDRAGDVRWRGVLARAEAGRLVGLARGRGAHRDPGPARHVQPDHAHRSTSSGSRACGSPNPCSSGRSAWLDWSSRWPAG